MPPHIPTDSEKLDKSPDYDQKEDKQIPGGLTDQNWNCFDHIIWFNVFWFTGLHITALYGGYLCFTDAKIVTTLFAVLLYHISLFGITAGVHRLWSHRSYKAKLPFRIILAICNSIAYQNSIYEWGRDHRVHHKYTESDADPVNSVRGFFFSHCGWLMCKKHPNVKLIGGKVDLSDMLADPVVAIQKKYYMPSVLVFCVLIPTLIPWYYWDETLWNAYFVCVVFRYIAALNATWFVNSAAHMWGYRPYDVNIAPAENISVAALTLGEGYHNFHHTFPWDYSTSEWGWNINITTFILDQLAKIGWVYDRRYATKDLIEKRRARTGPNSLKYEPHEHEY